MKKKIGLGIVAALMIAGAVVFANSNSIKKADNICPDRPDCICSKPATAQIVAKPAATTQKKDNCPNTPNCICK